MSPERVHRADEAERGYDLNTAAELRHGRLPELERRLAPGLDLLAADLRRRLADRRLHLELTDAARRHIAAEGFDPVYGARPVPGLVVRHRRPARAAGLDDQKGNRGGISR